MTPDVHKRPSWDEYFMGIAKMVATRATCDRGRSGSVTVMGHHILTTGYVGAPPGIAHCDDVGHEMSTVIDDEGNESKHCIRSTHAEQNAIVQAARNGVSLKGATLYCKMTPCYICAKLIITAGIVRVVSEKDYHVGSRTKEVFKEAGVQFDLLGEIEEYPNQ
jgi:dCMP deaminase